MKLLPILLVLTLSALPAGILAQTPDKPDLAPEPRIYRDRVNPHWIDPHREGEPVDRFWYRVDLPGDRSEFVLVDAAKGDRKPAFDHDRVAGALEKPLGHPVAGDQLPFRSLTFSEDGTSVTLHGQEGSWRVDLKSYEVSPGTRNGAETDSLPAQRRPHPSRSGGPATTITFVNQRAGEVGIYWIRPDGSRQHYARLEPGKQRTQNTYARDAWLVTDKNGEPIACYDAEEEPGVALITDPIEFRRDRRREESRPRPDRRGDNATSPDGKWEVVVRGDNLFLRDTGSGETERLTSDANGTNSYARNAEALRAVEMEYGTPDPQKPAPEVFWAPDSKRFVAMRHTRGSGRRITIVRSSPEDQLQPELVSIPYLKPGDDVPFAKPHLFDVGARKEIPIDDARFENPWSIGEVRWAGDSGEFTFLFNQRGHQALRILGVDSQSGAVRAIVDEKSDTFICYSQKFFAEYLDETDEIIWMSERDGWNHLYLYDSRTGTVKNPITRGEWVVRGVDRVDPEKREVWFRAGGMNSGEDPYFIHCYRIGFDGTGLTALTGGNGTHTVKYSPDKRYLIDTWSRVDQAPVSDLRRTDDGSLVCRLEESDVSELVAAGWPFPEPFVAKGRDGKTDIHGVIFRPKDFDPSKRYPVIEDIYAGPHDSFVPKAFRMGFGDGVLLEAGFIIVKIDGMGTSNRSKAFQDVAYKDLADAGFPDRIRWIKAAAEKYPYLDLDRVGIYGTSAGGQSSMRALLDHGDFYKAAVSDCGCHDNRMDKIWWNEQWLGWPVDESYIRSSNVEDAHKLKGEFLLMVGEMDTNVDPASSMQVADALIKAGKDFEFLVVPNMGHGVLSSAYAKRRMKEFFVRTLRPGD